MDHLEETVIQVAERPALVTYADLANRLEHQLLAPTLNEDQVIDGCRMAWEMGVAACCVRPVDVDTAVRILGNSPVKIGSVVGFPHGSANTATKLYEGRDLLRRGAGELSMVVNVGKLASRQFQHIETEILQMADSCRQNSATLKIIYECAILTDEWKIILSKILKRTETPVAVTSTGFGPGAPYSTEDLILLRQILRDRAELQASGANTLDEALRLYDAGCDRIGTTVAETILGEWKKRLTEQAKAAEAQLKTSEV